MPTTPFQCGVLVVKPGENEPSQCDFIVAEHATLKDAQMTYQNHLEVHKMNGSFLNNPSASPTKGTKMKVASCPKWAKDQTYESFVRDFASWQAFSDLTPQQERGFLVEMLKNCEKDEVKMYYSKNIMNSKTIEVSVQGILNKLKERFGAKEKQEWNHLIDDLQKYKWEENKTSD